MPKVRLTPLGLLAFALLLPSCLNLNKGPLCEAQKIDAAASCTAGLATDRADGSVAGGPNSPELDAPGADPNPIGSPPSDRGPVTDPGCATGMHKCNDECVSSSDPSHCGLACAPCPTLTGGKGTCDGLKCGVECPAASKPCNDRCVEEAAACDDK
jgi:hypothetical protein